MNTKKIAWGILSTARINQVIIPAIRNEPRCKLLAIASRDPDRAARYAKEWNIPRAYGDYEALLADHEIEAIYISLPNSLHAKWTIASVEAGKHVLCEKPLALSVEDCQKMIDAAEGNQVFLQEAMMYRYHPRARKLQEIVQSGILGSIQYIHAVLSFPLQQIHPESFEDGSDIRLNPSLGGGSLWDLGYYSANFARMISTSEPYQVRGWMKEMKDRGVDESFYGMLIFPECVVAHIECSFSQPPRFHGEIVGTEGHIQLPYAYGFLWDEPAPITLYRGGNQERIIIENANPFEREISHFCDCVLERKSRAVPLEDARDNVAVVKALYASAQKNSWVEIADIGQSDSSTKLSP